MGEEVTSEAREVRSYIDWDLFPVGTCWDTSSSSIRLPWVRAWVLGHNNVPDRPNDIYFSYSILVFMEVNEL